MCVPIPLGVPLSPPAGDTWDEAALAAFRRLTHCARWTPVLATVTSYSQSGLCPRPSVQLFGLHHNQVTPASPCPFPMSL